MTETEKARLLAEQSNKQRIESLRLAREKRDAFEEQKWKDYIQNVEHKQWKQEFAEIMLPLMESATVTMKTLQEQQKEMERTLRKFDDQAGRLVQTLLVQSQSTADQLKRVRLKLWIANILGPVMTAAILSAVFLKLGPTFLSPKQDMNTQGQLENEAKKRNNTSTRPLRRK